MISKPDNQQVNAKQKVMDKGDHFMDPASEVSSIKDQGQQQQEDEDLVQICQLRSASHFSLPIQVEGMEIKAVVDTAAEVTIISDRFYKSMKYQPKANKENATACSRA